MWMTVCVAVCTAAFACFAVCGYRALTCGDALRAQGRQRGWLTATIVSFAVFMVAGAAFLVLHLV